MNVIGDAAFNMYLQPEDTRLVRPAISRDLIVSYVSAKCTSASLDFGTKCYCSKNSPDAIAVSIEEKAVTECLISSLNVTNAENILSLTINYLAEGQALSEISLRAFIAFLIDSPDCAGEKNRIRSTLNEQLRLHPSCAKHMVPRYSALMLVKDNEFSKITVLEYVVGKLEKLVSSDDDVRISNTRTSKRCRRAPRKPDESPLKRPKKVEVFVDSDADETSATAVEPAAAKQQPDMENLVWVLYYLLEILRQNLGYTLKHQLPLHNSILAQLMFGAGHACDVSALNNRFLTSICQVLKNCDIGMTSILRGMNELLELVGDVCALLESQNDVTAMLYLMEPKPDRKSLINEFCRTVFSDKPCPKRSFLIVTNLRPEWLRYEAVRYLIEKILCPNVSFGVKGVTSVFRAIRKNIRERIMDTSNVLKLVNNNQLASNAEFSGIGSKKQVKNELQLRKALVDNKRPFVESEIETEIEAEDAEDKCIEFNVRQKLAPIVCKLLIVFVDSTIKIVKLTGTDECLNTKNNFNDLKNILNELCGEKNIPVELNMLRRRLNRIL